MAEFLHRQLMESDIDRLSGYVTGFTIIRGGYGTSQLNLEYSFPSGGGYASAYLKEENILYIGQITYGLKLALGENETTAYILDINNGGKATYIEYDKSTNKSVETPLTIPTGIWDGYFYFKTNGDVTELYIKTAFGSKTQANVEYEGKLLDLTGFTPQLGLSVITTSSGSNIFTQGLNIAYDISTLGGGETQEPEFEVKIIGNLGGTIEEFDISKLITVQGLQ